MKGCFVYDSTSRSVFAYLVKFWPIIRYLLSTFIAYSLFVLLSLTRNTSPKLPLPSIFIGMKADGPILSSSCDLELADEKVGGCFGVNVSTVSVSSFSGLEPVCLPFVILIAESKILICLLVALYFRVSSSTWSFLAPLSLEETDWSCCSFLLAGWFFV